jgi:arylsulfatase
VPKEYEQLYAGKVDADTAKFFGMIANIDDNMGRLLARLKEWGIEQDTLVVFMNDNGGTAGTKVFNAGMRGQKVTPWLGGTRAISFWRWPGVFKPADVSALTAHIDFFPTIAELAGAKLSGPVQAQVEGRNLVPLLRDPDAAWPDRLLFTHVGNAGRRRRRSIATAACAPAAGKWCVSPRPGTSSGTCSTSRPTRVRRTMWPLRTPRSSRNSTRPTTSGGTRCSRSL